MSAVKIQTVTAEGFEMDYFTFGEGKRAFVIIPGVSVKPITNSADAVAMGFSAFAKKYTVYVFDRKKSMERDYTVSDMADDTAKAMETLGIADADIYGASQGAMIVQLIAARYPHLVHKAVLAAPLVRQNMTSIATLVGWRFLALSGKAELLNRAVFEKVYSDEYRAKFAKAFAEMEKDGTPEDAERFAVLMNACMTFESKDEIGNIRCPVLAAGSKCDRVLTDAGVAELGKALGCETHVYDGYSHAFYDEAPDFRDRMMKFFN